MHDDVPSEEPKDADAHLPTGVSRRRVMQAAGASIGAAAVAASLPSQSVAAAQSVVAPTESAATSAAALPPVAAGSRLTTNQGLRISDDQNQLRAGIRGPSLLEDFAFREKVMHFDHERIPERVVHARGVGAHGTFELHTSLANTPRPRS